MPTRLELTADLARADDTLRRALWLLSPRQVLGVIGVVGLGQTQERFDSLRAGPDGRPWPATEWGGGRGTLLKRRGVLRNGVGIKIGSSSVMVGTNDRRARIHQSGGEIRPVRAKALRVPMPDGDGFMFLQRVRIKARPFLGINSQTIHRIDEAVTDRVVQAVRS